MTAAYGRWFRVGKTDVRWLEKSPVGRTARCDRFFNHVVQAEDPRFVVDSGAGPTRVRGKKKRNEYLCRACADRFYDSQPPSMLRENQGELF